MEKDYNFLKSKILYESIELVQFWSGVGFFGSTNSRGKSFRPLKMFAFAIIDDYAKDGGPGVV